MCSLRRHPRQQAGYQYRPGSEPAHVAAPSQASVRKNLSSAPHKLAECPEMRNFSKVVRTTRQVFEPDRPWTPLGYIGHSAMRAARPYRPLCHTRRPTMGSARPWASLFHRHRSAMGATRAYSPLGHGRHSARLCAPPGDGLRSAMGSSLPRAPPGHAHRTARLCAPAPAFP